MHKGHRTYLDIPAKRVLPNIKHRSDPELIERVRRAKAAGVQEDFYVTVHA